MSNLTDTQLRYLANAWRCFEAEPRIDYAKFARLSNLKSAASAREMLRVTKKKLFEHSCPDDDDDDSTVPAPTLQTPVKNGGGPRAATSKTATPASTGRKRPRSAAKPKVNGRTCAAFGEDNDGESGDDRGTPGGIGKKVKTEILDEDGTPAAAAAAPQESRGGLAGYGDGIHVNYKTSMFGGGDDNNNNDDDGIEGDDLA